MGSGLAAPKAAHVAGSGASPGFRFFRVRVALLLLTAVCANPSAALEQAGSEQSLAALGGRLVGRSNGEWGGSLNFEYGHGFAQRLLEKNVLGMRKVATSVVVFTGLAHSTGNEGAIYVVRRKSRDELSISLLHRLAGEPSEIAQHKSGAVHFGVFTGQLVEEDRPEGRNFAVTRKVLACQVLDTRLTLRSVPCASRVP